MSDRSNRLVFVIFCAALILAFVALMIMPIVGQGVIIITGTNTQVVVIRTNGIVIPPIPTNAPPEFPTNLCEDVFAVARWQLQMSQWEMQRQGRTNWTRPSPPPIIRRHIDLANFRRPQIDESPGARSRRERGE